MKPSYWDYLKAAFNAKPFGMFIAPNWIGVGLFAMLGAAIDPGFWVLGAGLEAGYLLLLANNPRFQRTVAAVRLGDGERAKHDHIVETLQSLGDADRRRYQTLDARCDAILDQQQGPGGALAMGLEAQGQSLERLKLIFLRLLTTRQKIDRVLRESADSAAGADGVESRLRALQVRLKDGALPDELRKSMTAQADILEQRLQKRREARDKSAFIDAELSRIQDQIELIREQAVLSTDPESLTRRIDEIASTVWGTSQWIRDQQELIGAMDDLLDEPPLTASGSRTKISQ